MAIEKSWSKVGPLLLMADGDKEGTVVVPSTANLYVKQKILIITDSVQFVSLEIKSVISKTTIKVGPQIPSMTTYSDLTTVLVAENAYLRADFQTRPGIDLKEHERAVFAEEPIVAKRTILVDRLGDYYDENNPFPVEMTEGAVSPRIANIEITDPNEEQTYTFSATTKRFRIRVRKSLAEARIAYVAGETDTNFWTVHRGSFYEEENVKSAAGITIYIKVNKPNQVIEILSWE